MENKYIPQVDDTVIISGDWNIPNKTEGKVIEIDEDYNISNIKTSKFTRWVMNRHLSKKN